jgi:hypothetical protein
MLSILEVYHREFLLGSGSYRVALSRSSGRVERKGVSEEARYATM